MNEIETNSRYRNHGQGVISEMIANLIQMYYDPTSMHAIISFNGAPYVSTDDGMLPLGAGTDTLNVDLQDRMAMQLVPVGVLDPVTGLDLSQLSLTGFMIAVKFGYDFFHNEREAARQAALISPEPEPEAP